MDATASEDQLEYAGSDQQADQENDTDDPEQDFHCIPFMCVMSAC
jgi:hypothetical protein